MRADGYGTNWQWPARKLCLPTLPRMTNTYMLGGTHEPEEIMASVKDGIYATAFGGGQLDITSGKFVFSCTEAYEIKNGKLGAPLKGATLIGTGPESMQRISMIGNDMAMDEGIGTCGKDGQGVPVGVGQPSLRLERADGWRHCLSWFKKLKRLIQKNGADILRPIFMIFRQQFFSRCLACLKRIFERA